jgi:hypothetical protein
VTFRMKRKQFSAQQQTQVACNQQLHRRDGV